jgi:hypothetical protein
MSDFVEQCRQEWERLGVPNPIAEEMAADLASDLEEAEAEGISATEYLGSSSAEPQVFAALWARERGIVPVSQSPAKTRRRPLALVAFSCLAAITVIVTALLLATGEPKMSLISTTTRRPHLPGVPALPSSSIRRVQASASAAAPIEWILLLVAVAALSFSMWLWFRWNRLDLRAARA